MTSPTIEIKSLRSLIATKGGHPQTTKFSLSRRMSESLEKKVYNPVVRATSIWSNLTKQLEIIVGATIYQKLFQDIHPIVIADNVLILGSYDKNKSHWLNLNYKEIIDTLLSSQDKKLTCAFITTKTKSY